MFRTTWFFVALLAGGLLLVKVGALPLWLWAALTALAVIGRLLPRLDPYRDELRVTAEGLSRQHGSRLRKTAVETVRWDDLTRVEVLSNETGPDRKDLLFLLYGGGHNGVAVPGSVARAHQLVSLLDARLEGFRKEALAEAEASTGRESWTLWEKISA
jgi:hypothetical protein